MSNAIIRQLRRARNADSVNQKNFWESCAFMHLRGMFSVWADDEGLNKEAYAMELLERIKEIQLIFKNDDLEKKEQQKWN